MNLKKNVYDFLVKTRTKIFNDILIDKNLMFEDFSDKLLKSLHIPAKYFNNNPTETKPISEDEYVSKWVNKILNCDNQSVDIKSN